MSEPVRPKETGNGDQSLFRDSPGPDDPEQSCRDAGNGENEEWRELLNEIQENWKEIYHAGADFVRAHLRLMAFLAQEKTRLFFARAVVMLHIWILIAIAWIALVYALARWVYVATGSLVYTGGTVSAMHAAAALILVLYVKALKI